MTPSVPSGLYCSRSSVSVRAEPQGPLTRLCARRAPWNAQTGSVRPPPERGGFGGGGGSGGERGKRGRGSGCAATERGATRSVRGAGRLTRRYHTPDTSALIRCRAVAPRRVVQSHSLRSELLRPRRWRGGDPYSVAPHLGRWLAGGGASAGGGGVWQARGRRGGRWPSSPSTAHSLQPIPLPSLPLPSVPCCAPAAPRHRCSARCAVAPPGRALAA